MFKSKKLNIFLIFILLAFKVNIAFGNSIYCKVNFKKFITPNISDCIGSIENNGSSLWQSFGNEISSEQCKVLFQNQNEGKNLEYIRDMLNFPSLLTIKNSVSNYSAQLESGNGRIPIPDTKMIKAGNYIKGNTDIGTLLKFNIKTKTKMSHSTQYGEIIYRTVCDINADNINFSNELSKVSKKQICDILTISLGSENQVFGITINKIDGSGVNFNQQIVNEAKKRWGENYVENCSTPESKPHSINPNLANKNTKEIKEQLVSSNSKKEKK